MDEASSTRMKRIQRVSRGCRVLCGVAFVITCLLAIAVLFVPITNPSKMDFHIRTPQTSATQQPPRKDAEDATTETKAMRVRFTLGGDDDQSAQPIEEKIKPGFRWTTRPILLGMILFWTVGIGVLYRLFKLYERGMIFTPANVRCIKWLGGWVLAAWVLSNVVEVFKLITYDSADVDFRIGATFFAGILVLLMSWIMEEGGKIQQEQALTI